MVTIQQLEVLTQIVKSNTNDPSYDALLDLLEAPATNSKTLEALRADINAIVDIPLRRRSRFARFFHIGRHENTTQLLHTRLRSQLNKYLDSEKLPAMARPTSTDANIVTGSIIKSADNTTALTDSARTGSDSSIRSLYMIPRFASGEVLSEDDFNNLLLIQANRCKAPQSETLLTNAMIVLMGYYKDHLTEYEKNDIGTTEKQFHKIRLLSIIEWTTTNGFNLLVQAITTFQQRVDLKDLAFNDNDTGHAQQELLSWVEVLSDAKSLKIAESPAAMRFIFNYLNETLHPLEQNRHDYIIKLEYFKSFFLGSAFADINTAVFFSIKNADTSFQNNLVALKELTEADWDNFKTKLTEIRTHLQVIYQELGVLWKQNAQMSERLQQFDLMQYTPSQEQNRHYTRSLQNALKFLAQNLSSSSRRSTGQSDEPLRGASSTKSTLGFTPREWGERDLLTKSKRHSSRVDKSPSSLQHGHVTFSGSSLDLTDPGSGVGDSNSAKHSNKHG